MTAEIYGLYLRNKGSQLMAVAIAQELGRRGLGTRLVVNPGFGSYADRASIGAEQKLWFNGLPAWTNRLAGRAVPRRLRGRFGLVLEPEIDVILDASGFRYSSQWGPEKAEEAAREFARWHRQGKRIVLLPQAFGPFDDERTRRAIRAMAASAQVIYARDDTSRRALTDVIGPEKVRQAPDFTTLLPGRPAPGVSLEPPYGCLVPNTRMLDMTDWTEASYVDLLRRAAGAMTREGVRPVVLLHEVGDSALGARVRDALPAGTPLVAPRHPLELKGVLGGARIVVASRFHALVSALSQAVPSIATGWSHKYRELMRAYACGDNLVSDAAALEDRVTASLRDHDPLAAAIRAAGDAQKDATRAMWDDVVRTAGLHTAVA